MQNETITIALFIRGEDAAAAAEAVKPVLTPYLRSIAGTATLTADDQLRSLKDGDDSRVTRLEFELPSRVLEMEDFVENLEKFLKVIVKPAKVSAKFELFLVERRATGDAAA